MPVCLPVCLYVRLYGTNSVVTLHGLLHVRVRTRKDMTVYIYIYIYVRCARMHSCVHAFSTYTL